MKELRRGRAVPAEVDGAATAAAAGGSSTGAAGSAKLRYLSKEPR